MGHLPVWFMNHPPHPLQPFPFHYWLYPLYSNPTQFTQMLIHVYTAYYNHLYKVSSQFLLPHPLFPVTSSPPPSCTQVQEFFAAKTQMLGLATWAVHMATWSHHSLGTGLIWWNVVWWHMSLCLNVCMCMCVCMYMCLLCVCVEYVWSTCIAVHVSAAAMQMLPQRSEWFSTNRFKSKMWRKHIKSVILSTTTNYM